MTQKSQSSQLHHPTPISRCTYKYLIQHIQSSSAIVRYIYILFSVNAKTTDTRAGDSIIGSSIKISIATE